jgi:serine/threonine-protein kinase HipA
MRRATVFMHGIAAGYLDEVEKGSRYTFSYLGDYDGPPISQTMPVEKGTYRFEGFPPFFDGLLPEGEMLEGLLRQAKIDRSDRFGQLVVVGGDMVGAVTVEEGE